MSKVFYKTYRYDAKDGVYTLRPVMAWRERLLSEDAKQAYIGLGVTLIGVFGLWLGGDCVMRYYDEYDGNAKNAKVVIRGASGGGASGGGSNNRIDYKESDVITNNTKNETINLTLNVTLNIDAKQMEAKTLSEAIGGVIQKLISDAKTQVNFKLEERQQKCLKEQS